MIAGEIKQSCLAIAVLLSVIVEEREKMPQVLARTRATVALPAKEETHISHSCLVLWCASFVNAVRTNPQSLID